MKPDEKFQSEEAYDFWRELLKQGHQIAPSSGKDWHSLEKEDENTAVTYVGLEKDTEIESSTIAEAIEKGRIYVTLGPRIDVSLTVDGEIFHLGETARKGSGMLQLEVFKPSIPTLETFSFIPRSYRILQSEEVIYELDVTEEVINLPVELEAGYIRVELIGDAKGKADQRLTITSPIYVD